MGNDRCRWVRHRLPLLAGGELGPEERRRVERHMIGCPDCRGARRGAEAALDALRSAAHASPVRADAPTLWPALARQIRESRHAAPRASLFPLGWSRLAPALWPAMGLSLGLGALMVVAISRGRDLPRPPAPAPTEVVADDRETPEAPRPRGALPIAPDRLTRVEVAPIEPPSTLRYDYDLDHGTPVGPVGRDLQRSY